MHAARHWKTAISLLALAATCGMAAATAPVSQLAGTPRDGQVFLTWQEGATPEGTTFNVYLSDAPIADVARARRIGHHVEPHSARDWWEDPASFTKGLPAARPVGFLIRSGGPRLDPTGGLFVHTVAAERQGKLFFAVTASDPRGREDAQLAAGVNSLSAGVAAAPGEIQPIWQLAGQPPRPGKGKGQSLWLNLHAKSGVVAHMEYLLFGDARMGWREGLPFKFAVRVGRGEVVVQPTDRVWINRPFVEAGDSGARAIWTFWYGYNSRIDDRRQMAEGVPANYTERRNLWILNWVRRYYQPDDQRWYCSGSSMGGCGTISFGLRHPELFAGLHANVPIVAYNYAGSGSAHRLEPTCWVGPIAADLKTDEGLALLDRMNATKFVRETPDDLPPLMLINGRQDGSIPWQNNPPFYRALNDAHQAFAAYWDNGTHPTCGKDAPEDVKAWMQRFRQFRRDRSYPAFANTSTNRNPGDGRPSDGDIIGWMNRGMDGTDVEDTGERYAITLRADYPGIQYPVRTDVTLRRVQQFKTRPAERLRVVIGNDPPRSIQSGANGRITIPQVSITSRAGTRIVIHRAYDKG
jgi:pimeloyl-ACP methyl ester carboxylesterase